MNLGMPCRQPGRADSANPAAKSIQRALGDAGQAQMARTGARGWPGDHLVIVRAGIIAGRWQERALVAKVEGVMPKYAAVRRWSNDVTNH